MSLELSSVLDLDSPMKHTRYAGASLFFLSLFLPCLHQSFWENQGLDTEGLFCLQYWCLDGKLLAVFVKVQLLKMTAQWSSVKMGKTHLFIWILSFKYDFKMEI